MQTYTSTWPDFFEAFFSLLPSNTSSEAFNVKTTDLVLRLLHETSTEISDSTLRLNKAHNRLNRDTELRDAIRVKDAAIIANQVVGILVYAMQHIDNPSSQISSQQAVDLAEMAMRVLADFACASTPLVCCYSWDNVPELY
jgi:exportin-T